MAANTFPDLPSDDEISDYLACISGDTRTHPYPLPARPSWRGGPPLDHADELAYRAEQDDQ